jgi:hypothetical protein
MAAGAQGLEALGRAQVLAQRWVVAKLPLNVPVKGPAAQRAVAPLPRQDLSALGRPWRAPVGRHELQEDLLGQRGQALPVPLFLAGQFGEPLLDLPGLWGDLAHHANARAAVQGLHALVAQAANVSQATQHDLGVAPPS